MARRASVSIDGQRIEFTNLGTVLYPETGTTKADVLEYYTSIAPLLIEHASWRPATLKRWVGGVGMAADPQSWFFQKRIGTTAPSWVKRFPLEHSDHTIDYPLVNDAATLRWLAQIAALEIHTPQWRFGPRGGRRRPDRLVIDLEPGEGVDLAQCAAVAGFVRQWLEGEGLTPMPVTSGTTGIHIYAALDGSRSSDAMTAFAHDLALGIQADHGDLVVSDMARSLRAGKVLIDWSQNNGSKTTIAPYSLRGGSRPTVAAPRTWREIASPALRQLEYTDIVSRMHEARTDPLHASDEPSGGGRVAPEDDEDELAAYRRRRTTSPRPETGHPRRAPGGDKPSFVVEEHHARRLHYDLRLQHDGMLESWALPQGVPLDPRHDELAIHIEDLPWELAGLVASVRASDEGGGTVRPWDSGPFDLQRWRDGEVVVARLHGHPGGGLGGARTFELLHTGRAGEDDDHWLMRAMDEPAAASGAIPFSPMLAASALPGDLDVGDWRFEMKWDGIRAVCEVRNGVASLWSRNGNNITESFPELSGELPSALQGKDAVVDGEIVALDASGRPSFERLQDRLGVAASGVASRVTRTPVHLMLFDVLEIQGETTVKRPYVERRDLLESLVVDARGVHIPPSYETDLDSAMAISERNGLEGVVAKEAHSPYRSGSRSDAWRKVKHEQSHEVVLVGWVEGAAGGLGSLLVAVPTDGGGLRYAGRVGTGFTDVERTALQSALVPLSRETTAVADIPRLAGAPVNWVEPSLVGEVRYSEWTRAGRMRHPSWRGLRRDKTATDVGPPGTT